MAFSAPANPPSPSTHELPPGFSDSPLPLVHVYYRPLVCSRVCTIDGSTTGTRVGKGFDSTKVLLAAGNLQVYLKQCLL